MKKIFLIILLIFGVSYSMEVKEFYKNMYMVRGVDDLPSKENKGFMSNAYAILTKEGWVIIDSLSTPELSKEFLDKLVKINNKPVKYLIITHYHPDHWYGARTFKEAGAVVIAHPNLNKFYNSPESKLVLENSNERFGGIYKNVKLIPADITIDNEKDIQVGEYKIKIISMTPAHTDNDIIVYLPNEKVAFVGDLAYINRIPFVGDRGASSKNWLNVLDKLKNMDIKIVLGGHNQPMGKESFDFTYAYISYLRENIKMMKDKGYTIDKIKEELNKNSPYKNYIMYNIFNDANIYKIFNELDLEGFE